jgi:hypothetical protein
MNNDEETKEKQEFLRIHILENGYDADEFMDFLKTLKGQKGLNVENWSKNDLIQAVQQFTQMNPRQDNIIINSNNQSQIEVNDKNEIDELQKDIIDKLNDKEFLQCKCSEKNGISDEYDLYIKISDPKVIEGNFFAKSYVSYLVETEPLGYQVRRRFNDFIWLHNILKSIYINVIIPPLYKKNNYLYALKDDQIAKRIRSLSKFIDEISKHPLLRSSQIFYDFISMKDDQDFTRKKDEYNKIILPTKAEDIKTLTGEINIAFNYDKEQYAEKVKNLSESNEEIMKRLIKEYKYLNVQLQNVITKIKKINTIWVELYNTGMKYSEGEIITGVYSNFSKFMNDWTKLYETQINLINENIREYYRYIRNEYHSIREYYALFETNKNSYKKISFKLKETKERLFEEQKIDEWGLDKEDLQNKLKLFRDKEYSMEKMLPEETKKVKDKKKMFGSYCNSFIDEYRHINKLNTVRHKESVLKFINEMSKAIIGFHVNLNEIVANLDALKEDV